MLANLKVFLCKSLYNLLLECNFVFWKRIWQFFISKHHVLAISKILAHWTIQQSNYYIYILLTSECRIENLEAESTFKSPCFNFINTSSKCSFLTSQLWIYKEFSFTDKRINPKKKGMVWQTCIYKNQIICCLFLSCCISSLNEFLVAM